MNCVRTVTSTFFLCGFLLALPAQQVLAAEAGSGGKRPNFLFIVVDDQSHYDFRFYNPRSTLDSPRIDALARQGMVFDAAYHMGAWVSAVCTPSRHMIMSGRTLWHIPNRGRQVGNPHGDNPAMVPPNLEQFTLAAIFNRAGYDTMRTCKPGNSYAAANAQFTVRRERDQRGGTDETGSAWHGDQVLDYLQQREAEQDDDPFLIYFGFSHPHDPRHGKPELLAKYGAVNHDDPASLPPLNEKQPPLPINYLPGHPFPPGQPEARDEERVEGVWTNRDVATIRNERGREFACSENIDIQIGRVLDKLAVMGELENTYVIYTSDHGIAIGRHGLQGKQNLYEHSWRVPLVVVGPGIQPGSRAPGNVYLLDIVPTLCDLAGIAPPETVEGVSFKPVLMGQQKTIRETLYGCYCGGTKPGMRSVRKGDWKLIKVDVLDGSVRQTQLFNLAENPHELLEEHHAEPLVKQIGNRPKPMQKNLADDPRYAQVRQEMEALLVAEMRRLDDPYRLWDQPQETELSPAAASQ